jgi:hypothetical protein
MLFNIFTPDEVDFLSTLIGDDALEEIQKDVDAELTSGAGLPAGAPPLSRRPPQFYDPSSEQPSKNVHPSFPGTGPQASSIRESLQVYHRNGPTNSSFPGEEGKLIYTTINRTSSAGEAPDRDELYKTAEERQQKVERLLNRLSTKYDEARANLTKSPAVLQGQASEDERPAEEGSDRMKAMIENLKQKLSTSRPGISQLQESILRNSVSAEKFLFKFIFSKMKKYHPKDC